MKDADLVAAYLAHAQTSMRDGTDAEHFAAADELNARVTDEPERAWPVICKIIKRIAHDDILAYVAAGPLEFSSRRQNFRQFQLRTGAFMWS